MLYKFYLRGLGWRECQPHVVCLSYKVPYHVEFFCFMIDGIVIRLVVEYLV